MGAAQNSLYHSFRLWLNRGQETGVAGTGKMAAETGAQTLSTTSLLGGAGAAGGTVFSVALVGGFAAVSTVVNQLEYMHERQEMAEFYEEELGSKLKKSAKKVNGADLDKIENGVGVEANKTIKEQSFKQRWIRNVGIGASMIASVAAFLLIDSISHGLGGVVAEGVGEATKHAALFSTEFFFKGAATLLAYMALKAPLAAIGNFAFGVNKETTHDKIVALAKDRTAGKSITREQVVGVFVSASEPLAEFVQGHFGKDYDKLALADKVHVADQLSKILPLDDITKNINLGITNASELAFTVDGQVSGVAPKLPERTEKPSMLEAFTHKCKHMAKKLTSVFTRDHSQEHVVAPAPPSAPAKDYFAQYETEEKQGPSFAERTGRRATDSSLSHTERITQARDAKILAPSTNTLQ